MGLGRRCPGAAEFALLGEKAHKLADRLQYVHAMEDLYRCLVTEWPADARPVEAARRLPTLLDDAEATRSVLETENRMMLWDAQTYMQDDILAKVDRAAMGVSLETRIPFLDHRVFQLAWRLPLDMKIRQGETKWALRQVLYRYVPRELIERPKAGFAVPVGQWLRGPLRDWAEDLLDEARLSQEGYFNTKLVRGAWS